MAVSIITPNYNNAPYVQQYLESLLDDPAVSEIVVYDNVSTDGSAELYEALGQPKIRVIRGDRGLGATLGRQEAVKACKNDLICFLDGDDWLGPGSVGLALDALRREDLDIALFRWVEVDAKGQNPNENIPTPEQPIDGRTAAELTMGGWRIHSAGVMRKSLYEKAWEGFYIHGYLSDEVLTRRLFLGARRVGGSEGKMFYRRIPKTLDPQQLVDLGRSTVRTLALGVEANLAEQPVRLQRRVTTRIIFGLVRRAFAGTIPKAAVGALLDEYLSIQGGWRLSDTPWAAVDHLLRVTRPLLR
jgi:glycosyltransferase involved in cell wall biosynthesis